MPLNKGKPPPKRPRLKYFDYVGHYADFITLLTSNKDNYFRESNIVKSIIEYMRDMAERERFSVDAFCFMPDHLHLLLRGLDERANLKSFIKLFKQKSGYWFKQKYNNNLWHLSYYDHVLRKDEAIKDIAIYIFNNPVRKGIVSDYREYPFNGSFTMDINQS